MTRVFRDLVFVVTKDLAFRELWCSGVVKADTPLMSTRGVEVVFCVGGAAYRLKPMDINSADVDIRNQVKCISGL